MLNINELMNAIVRMRDAANGVETHGYENCTRISFVCETCNELLKQLGQIIEDVQKNGKLAESIPQPEAQVVELKEVKGE